MPGTVVEPVHDWTVAVGDWLFGICEYDLIGTGFSQIYLGHAVFETRLSAWTVVAIGSIGLVVVITVLAFVISRFTARRPVAG